MSTLSAYLPADRRHALAADRTLPDRTHGSALFGDISGFTPLTEALTLALGAGAGAEELTARLNEVYDALVAAVDSFGGSVIGFSGDALTCWFDGDDGRRATACGLALQEAMGRFAVVPLPNGASTALSLKVAVANGPARRFLVGDPAVQLVEALAGATLARMAAGEHLAAKGELLVDEAVVAALGDGLRVREWRTDAEWGRFAVVEGLGIAVPEARWPELPEGSPSDEQLRPWLLPVIYQRLQAGQGDFVTELRPAVALFLSFDGIDYDQETAGAQLDAYIRWVQSVLEYYQGALLQLTIGDKGSYFYASLGAPVAHEDNTRRALLVAEELRQPPPSLAGTGLPRIGISQGLVRAGAYGGTLRRTYGALGDDVNLAARLMQRAEPGEVLVSERVRRAAGERFRLEELEPITVKGKREPLVVARFIGSLRHDERQRRRMVGREHERVQIAERLELLRRREHGGVIVIEGEAGIGKSWLVEDLLHQAEQLGLSCLTGAADVVEQSTPYNAWRAVFSGLLDMRLLQRAEDRRSHMFDLLEDEPELLAAVPLLNPILNLDLADNEHTAQLSGQARAERTRALLVELLQASASRSPKLLVIDDAHWLDSASWALVAEIAQQVRPLQVVLVTRPLARPPEELAAIFTDPATLRLTLSPLPDDTVVELLCANLGVNELPQAVVQLVLERAEGHPLFSSELVYALRDAKVLRIGDGRCSLAIDEAELRRLALPDTVQGVITSRIDRLPPQLQLTVKIASIIGRVFSFSALHEIYPIATARSELLEHLLTIAQLDIAPQETVEPELIHIFKHLITQEVAYSLLLHAQRRELHQATAQWYERTYADDLDAHYTTLAYHWKHAGVAAEAIRYLELAGAEALRSYANREAVECYSEVLRLAAQLPEPPSALRRGGWERRLGYAYLGLGRMNDACEHLEAAAAILGWPVPRTIGAQITTIGGNLLQQIRNRLARLRLEQGELGALSDEAQRMREAAQAYEPLLEVYFIRNNQVMNLHTALTSLNLAEAIGVITPELGKAYAAISVACGVIPAHPLARLYRSRAFEAGRAVNDQPALAYILRNIAAYHGGIGAWRVGRELAEEGIAITTALGDHHLCATCQSVLSRLAYFQGDFAQAAAHFAEVLEVAVARSDRQAQAWGLSGQADSVLPMGLHERSAALAAEALPLVADRTVEQSVYATLALVRLRQGDLAGARQAADHTAGLLAQSLPVLFITLEPYASVAEVYLALWAARGEGAAVKDLARQTRKALGGLNSYARVFPIGRPRANLYRGRYELLRGNRGGALRCFERSLALAHSLGMHYERGLAQLELAHWQAGAARRAHEQQARATLGQVGAAYDLMRLEAGPRLEIAGNLE